jgi:hypothetical protein
VEFAQFGGWYRSDDHAHGAKGRIQRASRRITCLIQVLIQGDAGYVEACKAERGSVSSVPMGHLRVKWSEKLRVVGRFAAVASSPAILLTFCWWAWDTIFLNDWGDGVALKVLLVVGFSWVVVGVGGVLPKCGGGRGVKVIALLVSVWSILMSAWILAPEYVPKARSLPVNDIGLTTLDCARMFWRGEGNPYTDDQVNPRPGLPPGYRGFHYGPGMLLCYAGSAFGPGGYRAFHFAWVAGMILVGGALAARWGKGRLDKAAAMAFFLAVLLASPGWWKEYFWMGVNDAAPLVLMGGSLLLVGRGNWGWAGVLGGLALSAKFSPAGFLLLALMRRDTPWKFWGGVMAGTLPLWVAIPFAPVESFRNIFLSRLYVEGTPTGLHHLLPDSAHGILTIGAAVGMVIVVVRCWSGGVGIAPVLRSLVVLACLGILGHKEVHVNHLTWLLFFGAILLAKGRELFWPWLAGSGRVWQASGDGEIAVNESRETLSKSVRQPLPVGK